MFDFHDFISSWSHLVMAGMMLFVALLLLRLTRNHPLPNRLAVLFYAGSAVALYTLSGLFHGVRYIGTDDRRVWQLLDQTAIFGLIYGSNVPLLVYLLPPRRRNWLLILMGGVGLIGAICLWTQPNHQVLVAAYIGIGLLGLVPMRTYFRTLRWWGSLWVFLMAGSYIFGAVCDAVEWPVLVREGWLKFTWHELFHICVIAGTVAHTILIIKYVIPAGNRSRTRRNTVDRGALSSHNPLVTHRVIPPALDRL